MLIAEEDDKKYTQKGPAIWSFCVWFNDIPSIPILLKKWYNSKKYSPPSVIRRSYIRFAVSIVLPSSMIIAAVVVAGWFLYTRAESFIDSALRTYLQTSATLAAEQFDPRDIARVRAAADTATPEYARLVQRLHMIRSHIPAARFAYIFRQTDDAMALAFVADADGLSSLEELDVNGNGRIDPNEEAGNPGDLYDITQDPTLQGIAFREPTVGNFYVDQWGELISGYAPIRDSSGRVIATLGIDMQAIQFRQLAQSIFSPLAYAGIIGLSIMLALYVGVVVWRRQVQSLRVLAAERSALIDLAMHQIGAPLAAFRWWTDLLAEQDAQRNEKDRATAYGELRDAIKRMEKIIHAMQAASAIQKGTMIYNAEIRPFGEILDAVSKELEPLMHSSDHPFRIEMDPSLQCRLDPTLVEGVLRELLLNAISYSPAGTPIVLRAHASGRTVNVEIEDKGYGIASEDIARLFAPFTRGADAYKHQPVGNGLGLYIARHIVEIGGGDISIDSTPGEGTTVRLRLPRQ